MLKNLIQSFRTAWKLPRWRWALLTAVVSDAIGFGVVLMPPVQWSVDAVTALVLLGVLGFRWGLLGALAIEVVPMLQLFPAWTLVVAALAGTEKGTAPPRATAAGPVPALEPAGQTNLKPTNHQPIVRTTHNQS